ncbi:MAG: glycoside hydrolase family 2 TIM barrel-domain containing protein [Chthoniobacter sp.]
MNSSLSKMLCAGLLAGFACMMNQAHAEAIKVELVKTGDGWQLMREGKPYLIKGAGITSEKSMAALKAAGGNSVRLWGTEFAQAALDEAQKLGLTVAVGIWLRHDKDKEGFDYSKPEMVKEQLEKVRKQILQFKDHPAVLLWGIGNEMEGYKEGNDPNVWKAVNEAAKLAKELDPNHPTMTVFAEVGGKRVECVHQYCPDVDIVGLNTYAGASSIGTRYVGLKGTKPYILTEFGPFGAWEVGKTDWGAAIEPTSTAKAETYLKSYKGSVEGKPLCLGSYVFLWGNKQETTATWYGMFLKSGEKVQAVDVMTELWTGKPPENRCPVINKLKINGVGPAGVINVDLEVSDPDKKPLQVQWLVQPEQDKKGTGGEEEPVLPELTEPILVGDATHAEVRLPKEPGAYRIFVYVRNGTGAAVGNLPVRVHPPSEGVPEGPK